MCCTSSTKIINKLIYTFMKSIFNKTKNILSKYETEICAALCTIIFTGLFCIVLTEVIAQAFL